MSEKSKIERFKKGFKLGIMLTLIFQAVTLLDFLSMATAEFGTRVFVHRFWDFGFPFSMFSGMYASFFGEANFLGFVLNIIFAIIFSLSLALIFGYVNSLKSLIKSKFFVVGFLFGVIMLIGLNFISYFLNRDPLCFDCMDNFGFPLIFGRNGGFVTHTEISWYLLSKNIIIWGIFCFYSGFLFDLLQRKFLQKELK